MVSNSNKLKSRLALIFSLGAFVVLLGMTGWFGFLVEAKAQSLRSQFASLDSSTEKILLSGSIPEMKARTAQLFRQFPELKMVSVTGTDGVVYLTSRHEKIQVPQDVKNLGLPPLYLPEFPWEEMFSHSLEPQGNRFVVQFLVTVYDVQTILDSLKIMVFILLGTLLLALLIQLVLKSEPEQDSSDTTEEDSEEGRPHSPAFSLEPAGTDIPDLDPLPPLQDEQEEFWIQEEPEMDAAALEPPGSWGDDRLPDLDLPPLNLQDDFPPLNKEPDQPPTPRPEPKGGSFSTPFDPETGAVWSEFLEPRLESEIRRAADHNQDLVMAIICAEDPLEPGEMRQLRDLLVEAFPLKDLIFNRGDHGFTLLLPQKTLETAMKDLSLSLKRREVASMSSRIVAGLSSRSGRLLDQKTLVEEAEKALEKAGSGHENLIGFKADPDKYRNFLARSAKE